MPDRTYQDWYFFGHGHDYKSAMMDFVAVSGPINMMPRYVFGPQYSRWHAYNENDEVTLVETYEAYGVPLDVLVLDMDWHWTYPRTAPKCSPAVEGWSGYTWDTTLFPNPQRFLSWAKAQGLHITNNMHPARGVQCSEALYPQMAAAIGWDTAGNASIPYDLGNKTYAFNFMDVVLKPLSGVDDGIDYWWIDYQQGEQLIAPSVNPTFWVNYVFSSSTSWFGPEQRSLIMARWGGLGNHRLSDIGFSGDVITSWASLGFQPYFTVTAANVGFMWSHDLGGFFGQPSPELYTRWIQWGAYSNILRTHSYGKEAGGWDRAIWLFPYENFVIMREAFVGRS
eukprot:TRINITY_DN6617_c0_g2_i1.p1 TRINITY_DN6617_c0_g2~~TRINITY_DN6617_c0_g2_i1.p1  ORF type:complete len:338 (-),score=67.08 TRINITY_DN6617_c0_g2_i1:896-1909(-)